MPALQPALAVSPRLILAAVAALGFSAVISQFVLLRELFGALAGNELVFAIGLGAWLLLTGMGAAGGTLLAASSARLPASPVASSDAPSAAFVSRGTGRVPPTLFSAGLAWVAVAPTLAIVAVRLGRDLLFVRGSTIDMPGTILACVTVLAPFCLVSGALLPVGTAQLRESRTRDPVSSIYLADVAGSLVGGLLFSWVLVGHLDSFATAAVAAAPVAFAGLRIALGGRLRVAASLPAGAAIALATANLAGDPESFTTGRQYHAPILSSAATPYGRIVITRGIGSTVFVNGIALAGADDAGAREEAVHYVLAQRPGARRVLMVAGFPSGAAQEVLAYGAERVTTVELDPRLTATLRARRPEADDEQITVVHADGRRFIQQTADRFDAVILNLPDPVVLQLNRYFTAEFFAAVHRVLTPDGVFGFGLARYDNFVSPELAQILATAHATLRTSFRNVRLFPGGRVYFVASDAGLSTDAVRECRRRPSAQLARPEYLDAMLTPDRMADLDRAIARSAQLNRDFAPRLHQLELRRWVRQHGGVGVSVVAAALLAALAYVARARPMARVVFAAGFGVSALQVVLLLATQIWFGSLYRDLGWMVTACMAGLALGVWLGGRAVTPRLSPGAPALAIGGFALACGWALPRIDLGAGGALGEGALAAVLLVLGALGGAQFALASRSLPADPTRRAASLLGADLIGAAFGALLAGAWLIPQFGPGAVCGAIAALNAAAAGALCWRTARAA